MRRRALWLLVGFAGVVLLWFVAQWIRRPEWEAHQRAYNALQRSRGSGALAVGVRSIRVRGTGDDERCVSCHLGMVLPPAPAAPFQAHPDTGCGLNLSMQGCTACHRGQGLSLTSRAAHGLEPGSGNALLTGSDRESRKTIVQAGCAGCHQSRIRGVLRYDEDKVPVAALGLRLFLQHGCVSCHKVAGVYNAGDGGPVLTDVGSRRSPDAMRAVLRGPQQVNPASPMPAVGQGAALEALSVFLLAQVGAGSEAAFGSRWNRAASGDEIRLSDEFDESSPLTPNPASGARWARKVGCVGCHRMGDGDTGVPELTRVAWLRNEADLREVIRTPRKRFPATFMPALDLPDTVAESIVAYLTTQRLPLPSYAQEVFNQVCSRCHGERPDPNVVVLSKRPPWLRERSQIEREKFLDVATKGVDGTAMAPWGRILSPAFLGSIYDSLK
jgi:mono/diheme cytochrome c family protein